MAEGADSEAAELCRFFSLPGKLRNRVYRYILIQPDNAFGSRSIYISADGYSRPGLLSTCKAIRTETLQIYYYENKFSFVVLNFDSTPLIKWRAQQKIMGLRRSRVTNAVGCHWRHGQASWPNLLLWLRHLHEKQATHGMPSPRHLLEANSGSSTLHLLGGLFVTVKEFRDNPWARVEKHIRNFRPSLIAIDDAWARD